MIWDDDTGIIPPVWGDGMGDRSPLPCSIVGFVKAFAFTPHRAKLIQGLLDYRAILRKCIGRPAIQWVNGSFAENIESLEARDPNDIDVVTVFPIQAILDDKKCSEAKLNDHAYLKETYHVDAYHLPLGQLAFEQEIRMLTYWFVQWSRRRDGRWKGFLQLLLYDDEEEQARELLKGMQGGEHG